jgi:hypothetical protein
MKRLIKKNFLNINSPEELSKWMQNNFDYGYVTKDGKIMKGYLLDNESDQHFDNNYNLQSPQQLYKSKIGVCWDQTEFERYFFDKFNISYRTFYIEQNNKDQTTHSYLVYQKDNEYYWFENSYEKYRGIHGPFNNEKEIAKLIHDYMFKDAKDTGYKVYVLDKPKYDIGCQQYMDWATRSKFYEEINK